MASESTKRSAQPFIALRRGAMELRHIHEDESPLPKALGRGRGRG